MAIPAMRAKRVLGSKTGGQQSPIPELKEPWAPEWERADEVRRAVEEEERGGKEEGKREESMSSMSTSMADSRIKDQDQDQGLWSSKVQHGRLQKTETPNIRIRGSDPRVENQGPGAGSGKVLQG